MNITHFLMVGMMLLAVLPTFSQICLYVANDLGRNGYYQQKPIAELMGRMAQDDGPDAVLALGDVHHFEGVASVADPLWLTNYEYIYSHPELMIPWFAIPGNHEYRGNTQAVLDYSNVSRRWNMPQRYYTKVFNDGDTQIRLIMLDTTPLIAKYRNDTTTYADAAQQDPLRQTQWLDSVLTVASEPWIVVAGHHPIYADTGKSVTERQDMQQNIDRILRRHRVDMYICGHIHNFQHIRPAEKDADIDYIVNSSASLARKKVNKVPGSLFVSGEPGFSRITAQKDSLRLDMIDAQGQVIHSVLRTKNKK